jgi:hypothetical protein
MDAQLIFAGGIALGFIFGFAFAIKVWPGQ